MITVQEIHIALNILLELIANCHMSWSSFSELLLLPKSLAGPARSRHWSWLASCCSLLFSTLPLMLCCTSSPLTIFSMLFNSDGELEGIVATIDAG